MQEQQILHISWTDEQIKEIARAVTTELRQDAGFKESIAALVLERFDARIGAAVRRRATLILLSAVSVLIGWAVKAIFGS